MVKLYEESDYEEIASWWRGYDAYLDKKVVPKIGFVGFSGNSPAFSAFIMRDPSSSLAWFCFPCANPAVRREKRYQAMDEVIIAAQGYAKIIDVGLVGFIHKSPIIERMKGHGFFEGDPKPINLQWKN